MKRSLWMPCPSLKLAEHDRLADPFAGGSRASQRSLSDYFTQQHRLFEDTELAALLEPRRIQAPPGYHSTKCVSAGLFVLLGNRVLRGGSRTALHPHGNRRPRRCLPVDSVSCPDLLHRRGVCPGRGGDRSAPRLHPRRSALADARDGGGVPGAVHAGIPGAGRVLRLRRQLRCRGLLGARTAGVPDHHRSEVQGRLAVLLLAGRRTWRASSRPTFGRTAWTRRSRTTPTPTTPTSRTRQASPRTRKSPTGCRR